MPENTRKKAKKCAFEKHRHVSWSMHGRQLLLPPCMLLFAELIVSSKSAASIPVDQEKGLY